MSIKCYLVALWLSAASDGAALPRLIGKHIDGCERCRKEAAAYKRLNTALLDGIASDEKCELTWAEIKASAAFNKNEAVRPRLPLILSASAACVLLVAIIGTWMLCQPKNEAKIAWIPLVTTPEVNADQDKPQQIALPQQEKPRPASKPAVQPAHKPERAAVKQIIKPRRTVVAEIKKEKPVKNIVPQKEEVAEAPNDTQPATANVITSNDEEHVIGVMRTTSEVTNNDDLYTPGQGDQPRFVLVDL
ncbi:MAG: hypothetical protein ABFD46_00590 [Armatimonadota bacterium]